jgi:hypothetical protein
MKKTSIKKRQKTRQKNKGKNKAKSVWLPLVAEKPIFTKLSNFFFPGRPIGVRSQKKRVPFFFFNFMIAGFDSMPSTYNTRYTTTQQTIHNTLDHPSKLPLLDILEGISAKLSIHNARMAGVGDTPLPRKFPPLALWNILRNMSLVSEFYCPIDTNVELLLISLILLMNSKIILYIDGLAPAPISFKASSIRQRTVRRTRLCPPSGGPKRWPSTHWRACSGHRL